MARESVASFQSRRYGF